MPEFRFDPVAEARNLNGLGELAYQMVGAAPRAEVFARKDAEDQWERVTAGEFLGEVTAIAKGLIAAGIGAGDRVVLVCGTRYEWVLINFAIWAVRAVSVPVHAGCSVVRLRHILRDCRPAAVILEDGRHAVTVAGVQHELTDLGRTWRLDESGLEAIIRPGAYMDSTAIRFRREETSRKDPATLLYPVRMVVGTRGAVLTHGNFLAAAEGLLERLGSALTEIPEGRATAVMGAPLADIQGHAALVACVMGRVRLGFLPPGAFLLRELRTFRPTILLADADLLEQVHSGERARASEAGWDNLNSFDAATDLAVSFDKTSRRGAWKRVSRMMYDWMYSRIRDVLGGRVRLIVCSGLPLSERMDRFYSGADIPVYQAFGTVETAGAFVANGPEQRQAGTVGRPLPGVEVRLGSDDEVYVRGPGMFPGYWNSPETSQAAFRNGWLATGFRGEMDAEGYLLVRERLRPQASRLVPERSTLVSGPAALPASSSAGEEGAPQRGSEGGAPTGAVREESSEAEQRVALERRLCEHPLISQAMVIVEGRPYATALITLLPEQVEYWRLVNNRPLSMPAGEITADPELLREVQAVVHEANGVVSAEARVRAFHVLAEEFSVQSGLVRPTGELRREMILRAFSEEIDGLYQVPEIGGRG
ncbi:AMP-dependent synthetase/ligase [Allosalinactinospora lopnorensis]|uniref:AMP-dependent synthetase/ligase n=1 Tax=Allosalinactinospora lopnorensis TaxID=1352348 RepID=UPI000623E88D|nr:AMP-binding protein [Allosalinactinospora lopnorensis]